MNKIFIITIIIISMWSCDNKHDIEPTCFSCDNEKNIDTSYNIHAKVVNLGQNPLNGEPTTYGFTIQSRDLQTLDASYTTSQDSLFVVCPKLDENFRTEGKHVIISYYLKSCSKIMTSPSDRTGFGKKIEIITIKNF